MNCINCKCWSFIFDSPTISLEYSSWMAFLLCVMPVMLSIEIRKQADAVYCSIEWNQIWLKLNWIDHFKCSTMGSLWISEKIDNILPCLEFQGHYQIQNLALFFHKWNQKVIVIHVRFMTRTCEATTKRMVSNKKTFERCQFSSDELKFNAGEFY